MEEQSVPSAFPSSRAQDHGAPPPGSLADWKAVDPQPGLIARLPLTTPRLDDRSGPSDNVCLGGHCVLPTRGALCSGCRASMLHCGPAVCQCCGVPPLPPPPFFLWWQIGQGDVL